MSTNASKMPKPNHPLNVYTVLFLAIIFLAVSIFSGDISKATGSNLAFIVLLGAFFIKMAIDDYMHFYRFGSDRKKPTRAYCVAWPCTC